jgi:hypothetical protein
VKEEHVARNNCTQAVARMNSHPDLDPALVKKRCEFGLDLLWEI